MTIIILRINSDELSNITLMNYCRKYISKLHSSRVTALSIRLGFKIRKNKIDFSILRFLEGTSQEKISISFLVQILHTACVLIPVLKP
jgi:hypothetical protein